MSNGTYEFTGKVIKIEDKKTFDSGFYLRTAIIKEEADQYPQEVPFDFKKKNCDKFENEGICVGDTVTVTFNLSGREWNGRYFSGNDAWKIRRHGAKAQQPPADDPNQSDIPDFDGNDALDEDVPF